MHLCKNGICILYPVIKTRVHWYPINIIVLYLTSYKDSHGSHSILRPPMAMVLLMLKKVEARDGRTADYSLVSKLLVYITGNWKLLYIVTHLPIPEVINIVNKYALFSERRRWKSATTKVSSRPYSYTYMFTHITNILLKANTNSEDKWVIKDGKRTKWCKLSAKGECKWP